MVGDKAINEYLNGTLSDIPSWSLLKDIDKAVEILAQKIREKAKIRIIGDYDIDGVTATYILLKGLKKSPGKCGYLYSRPYFRWIWDS